MTSPVLSDVELLGRLVAFDSTSHRSNRPIAEFICDYLDRPSVQIEQLHAPAEDKINLMIHIGPPVAREDRAGLVLSGHMDVVPATEPDWHSDPFTLTETDAGFVGRGACDMKGFDALAINRAAQAAVAGDLRHPLVLVLTYDEEIGTVGAHDFVRQWPGDRPLPRRAIIGEPTSLSVVRLHKGHAKLRLTVDGEAAHSGYPHLGASAIEPAARAIVALQGLREELMRETCPNEEHFPDVPFVALNVGTVHGGSAVNIVPERCVAEIGFRLLPGMESQPIVDRVRDAIDEAIGDSPHRLEPINASPPLHVADDNDFYRHLCQLRNQRETMSASYATDGGWLATLGLDCLIFGPGTIEVAHKPNEIMPRDQFHEAGGLIDGLIDRYCRH